jgi:uncharacterized membrane-anchored protein
MATWVILYGGVQAIAPRIVGRGNIERVDGRSTTFWVAVLLAVTMGIAIVHSLDLPAHLGLIPGLFVFGGVFAINSSLHSYLIVHYADRESTSIDVGFYYMANAAGRLFGTLLSGLLTLQASLSGCLLGACVLIALSLICSLKLPQRSRS